MDFEKYTQKSLEAVQLAQNIARAEYHQQLEQTHMLLALLQQENGLIPQLLRKMDVTVERGGNKGRTAKAASCHRFPGSGQVLCQRGSRRSPECGPKPGAEYER